MHVSYLLRFKIVKNSVFCFTEINPRILDITVAHKNRLQL